MTSAPQTTRAKKLAKPTSAQRRVLTNILAGRHVAHGINGNSAHGGLSNTILSLHKRGWIRHPDGMITEAGKAALA